MKSEIEPNSVTTFIDAIENITVKTIALLLSTSGLRIVEVLSLKKTDIDRYLRSIIPNCHNDLTKHSGFAFYNSEAEEQLAKYEKEVNFPLNEKLFVIGHQTFLEAWNKQELKLAFT